MCKIVRLAAVVRLQFFAFILYLDWQTFSTKTPHGARYKYKCGSCASNYLIGVNWRRLQAHCCCCSCCYWLLLYAFLLAFSTCAVLTWPNAADTVCNQVEILIYMEWPFLPLFPRSFCPLSTVAHTHITKSWSGCDYGRKRFTATPTTTTKTIATATTISRDFPVSLGRLFGRLAHLLLLLPPLPSLSPLLHPLPLLPRYASANGVKRSFP